MAESNIKQLLDLKYVKHMVTHPKWLTHAAAAFGIMLLFWLPAIIVPARFFSDWREFLHWTLLYLLVSPIPGTLLYVWPEIVPTAACLLNALAWFLFFIMVWVIIGFYPLNSANSLFLALSLIPATILCTSKPPAEIQWLKDLVLRPQWLALTLAFFLPLVALCELLGMDAISRWGLLFLALSMGGATLLAFRLNASLGLALDLPAFSLSDKPSQLVLTLFAFLLFPGIVVSIYCTSSINGRANHHERTAIQAAAAKKPGLHPLITESNASKPAVIP